jgi:pimeloyl-ACP methyl ester carboxylesterase
MSQAGQQSSSALESGNLTSKKIAIGQVVIEAHIQGAGETVVLIPGQGLGADSLSSLAKALNREGFRTVVINLRGVGESKGPVEGLTLHDYAKDVVGVIKSLGVANAHILGPGLGSRIGRCVASRYPEVVKSVILLAAGGYVGPMQEAVTAAQKLAAGGLSKEEELKAIQGAYFSPKSDPRPWLALRIWKEVAPLQTQAIIATKTEDYWSGGTAPVLAIQGLDDKIAPPTNGRALRDEFSNRVTLVELPDAGHALFLEKPEEIAKAVKDYIQTRLKKSPAVSGPTIQSLLGAQPYSKWQGFSDAY